MQAQEAVNPLYLLLLSLLLLFRYRNCSTPLRQRRWGDEKLWNIILCLLSTVCVCVCVSVCTGVFVYVCFGGQEEAPLCVFFSAIAVSRISAP
jgi:hypothetical protein